MQQAPGTLAPVIVRLIVPLTPEAADAVFVRRIGQWWPLETHSVYGADASVAFEAGRIVETGPGGERAEWGSVMDHEVGRWLETTWHPGGTPQEATRLSIRFAPVRLAVTGGATEATEVRLEHSGWEHRDDGAAIRPDYERDWPMVLELYGALAAEAAAEPAESDSPAP